MSQITSSTCYLYHRELPYLLLTLVRVAAAAVSFETGVGSLLGCSSSVSVEVEGTEEAEDVEGVSSPSSSETGAEG